MFAKELPKMIRTLATLEPADAPVVTCYLDLGAGEAASRDALDRRVRVLGHAVGPAWREPFESTMSQIRAYIRRCISPVAKGAAIFARRGSSPMFLPIQTLRRLPARLVVNSVPDLFDLLGLEDDSHGYLAARVGANAVCIFEVRLGAITRPIWERDPRFRLRFVRQRGRAAYGRRGPDDDDIRHLAVLLDSLAAARAPDRVIVDGSGRTGKRVMAALPESISSTLLHRGSRSRRIAGREVLEGLRTAAAEFASLPGGVEGLRRELLLDGLAVAGTRATMDALMDRQLDLVVMTSSYQPDPGWVCRACWEIEVAPREPAGCPGCGKAGMVRFDVRADMVRAAGVLGCPVEAVEDGGFLDAVGGVGALLRFEEPLQARYREAA